MRLMKIKSKDLFPSSTIESFPRFDTIKSWIFLYTYPIKGYLSFRVARLIPQCKLHLEMNGAIIFHFFPWRELLTIAVKMTKIRSE